MIRLIELSIIKPVCLHYKRGKYNSGQVVKFKNGDTGTMSDLQVGDGINITVDDNQVTAITVTSRNLSEGAIKGTVFSVNTTDEYIVNYNKQRF